MVRAATSILAGQVGSSWWGSVSCGAEPSPANGSHELIRVGTRHYRNGGLAPRCPARGCRGRHLVRRWRRRRGWRRTALSLGLR